MTGITRRQALGVLRAAGTLAGATAMTGLVSASGVASVSGGARTELTWKPPPLVDPEVIEVGTTADSQPGELDVTRDFVIKLPPTVRTGKLVIHGGRNVVLVGGHIRLPPVSGRDTSASAILVTRNVGVVHIEGVLIEGGLIDTTVSGQGDGIAIQSRASIVQVQNCRIVDLVGSGPDTHSDVIQPWGGVKQLRIDRLTGSSNYQGFFVPQDLAPIGHIKIKRTNLIAGPEWFAGAGGGYMLWMGRDPKYTMSDFYIQPRSGRLLGNSVWPDHNHAELPVSVVDGVATWPAMTNVKGSVRLGPPPGGDFCPAGVAGVGYAR
ncbi:hypothetical protein [Jiangella asiatica]|uniref:Right-handed parallel beta-helix repeat-containing protein n=1 Tax=Jiangella asiatica TaxID=2530372 RepID=A0A4R5CTP8_9ACTN|nr:hypothetical protein [Jiangella asiatica]TDE02790.1 hypothetical protein E1269_21060 [Jiangella asiatica]